MKTVIVRTEKQYEITLAPEILTQEFVTEFESYMWELDGDTLDEKLDELYAFAARQLAQGEEHFIEGLGHVASVRTVEYKRKDGLEVNVVWDDVYEDVETEVV